MRRGAQRREREGGGDNTCVDHSAHVNYLLQKKKINAIYEGFRRLLWNAWGCSRKRGPRSHYPTACTSVV